jgi:hypothetical protein
MMAPEAFIFCESISASPANGIGQRAPASDAASQHFEVRTVLVQLEDGSVCKANPCVLTLLLFAPDLVARHKRDSKQCYQGEPLASRLTQRAYPRSGRAHARGLPPIANHRELRDVCVHVHCSGRARLDRGEARAASQCTDFSVATKARVSTCNRADEGEPHSHERRAFLLVVNS